MSQSMQKTAGTQPAAIAPAEALAIRVALNQNLAGMPDEQIWAYYRTMCDRLELDAMSHPFDIITTTEKKSVKIGVNSDGSSRWQEQETEIKKLYPNSVCSSQLGDKARLNYGEMKITVNDALVALGFKVAHVSVKVESPNGRSIVAEAFVDLMSGYQGKALSGNNLVNALKKAGTQCRRRGTLQMLGLALPSEEIPTIKLGDMEREEGSVDGFVIEHPPASAIQSADTRMIAGASNVEAVDPALSKQESRVNSALLDYCEQQKGAKNDAHKRYFDAVYGNKSLEEREAAAAKLGLLSAPALEKPASNGAAAQATIDAGQVEPDPLSSEPDPRAALIVNLEELRAACFDVTGDEKKFYDELERQTGARTWTGKTTEELQTIKDGMSLYYKSLTTKKKK